MPFTPFHMGAVLICKPISNSQLSILTFGIAQVIMDIEPGIGMITGAKILHGPSHTVLGALITACFVILISPKICSVILQKTNKELKHYQLHWLIESENVTRKEIIISAFFGTFSHIVLDSVIHADIQPLTPFSDKNPLFGIVPHDQIYMVCAIAGILGLIIWFFKMWINGRKAH